VSLDPIFLELLAERRPMDSEHLGGGGSVLQAKLQDRLKHGRFDEFQ
jgi:hypothetical protein